LTINCIIVEDEHLARQKLELYVNEHEALNLLASYTSAEDFLEQAKVVSCDILLLDIGLPNIDGVSLAGKLPENCSIIFTTAYSEYAVEAFNLNAVDYLLKPFDFERFCVAIKKLKSQKLRSNISSSNTILIKEGKKIHQVKVDDILYVKGLKEYVTWHTSSGKLVTLHSLSDLRNYLKPFDFVQTHKSYIINAQKVSSVEYGFVYLGNEQIPIGRSFRGVLKARFKTSL